MATADRLALLGGKTAVGEVPAELFHWPIVTAEDEAAVLEVLRQGAMSGNGVSKAFEEEFAAWNGRRLALSYPNGTEALRAAFWACGVGAGDEIICPSMTYWASCTSALGLGAAVHFADIRPDTLCLDPADIEQRIGPRTRLVVVVHYAGHPCDMDAILAIARRHGLKVVEDVSHAHGGLLNGRQVGTFGDLAAMSLMSGKPLAIGEGGMLLTDDRALYERCISYGFYERTGVASRWNAPDAQVTLEELKPYAGVPLGGFKHRLNQAAAAMGRVQLRHYPARMQEIQDAMNRFWDLLEGVPGLHAHRPPAGSGSTMGGWYTPRGLYRAEELGGLSCGRFCEAVRAEGFGGCWPGANVPLHLHPVFHTADLFRMGRPTMVAFGQRDVRQGPGSLPVAERIQDIALGVPSFKRDRPEHIRPFADAFRKVAENADRLLPPGASA
jgi:dTDP-4-amino-4,6-dideoxygalactose transaminase